MLFCEDVVARGKINRDSKSLDNVPGRNFAVIRVAVIGVAEIRVVAIRVAVIGVAVIGVAEIRVVAIKVSAIRVNEKGGRNMFNKRWSKIICVTLLGLFLTSTAFAALDTQAIGVARQKSAEFIPYDWPIAAHCSATDVNLRSAPKLDSEVVGALQSDDQVYIEEFSDALYEGYPWAAITTEQGKKGYVNARFLDLDTDAMTRAGRFKAAFNSTVFWEFEQMVNAFNGISGNGNMGFDTNENGHFDAKGYKIALGDNTGYSYGRAMDNKLWQSSVRIVKSGYQAAGLEVGNVLDATMLERFNADMQSMGWRHGNITSDAQKWYLDGRIDGKTGPIRGFFVTLNNDGTIKELFWQKYFSD